MSKLLTEYGIVKNEAKCVSLLKASIKELQFMSDEKLIQAVNKKVAETNKVRYFTFAYLELDESESGKEVMWVDSGYTNILGNTVYLQFTGGTPWTGCFVGTEESILEYQKNYRAGKSSIEQEVGMSVEELKEKGITVVLDSDTVKETEKSNHNDGFLNLVFDKLLIPHSWSIDMLDNYITCCISRLNSLISRGEDVSSYVSFNKENSMALLNSGLLDKFGKNILMTTRIFKNMHDKDFELGYTGWRIAGCKADLCSLGFSKEDLGKTIERVSFTKNGLADLVFQASIEDFDLDNRMRLEHCIVERKFRFPDSHAEATEEMICADIIKAVELAVELSKYDRNYIKPMYNRKKDEINFVIPYHVSNNFQKKPELGIVIACLNQYWQIMTVLEYDDVMRDIKLFSMYENETF